MKTKLFKSNLVILFVTMTVGAFAQSANQQKTCIKVEEITNGKIINIDTCFIGLTEAEIQKQLTAMGVGDIKDMGGNTDSIKLDIDKDGNDNSNTHSEILIMNDDKNGDDGDAKVKIITDNNGKYNTVVVGGNGYGYTTSNESSNNLSHTEIVVKKTSGDSNNTKTDIYVYKKIEVTDPSDSDIIKSHTNVSSQANPFSGLEIYPNPAESTVSISYKSFSSAPLKIRVYDANGKTIYTQEINQPGGQVNQIISLSGYTPGIYFVNLEQGSQNETKKIVVK